MKNNSDTTDEACIVETPEESNEGCQVRRRIEDYLERRRYKDELGEFNESETR